MNELEINDNVFESIKHIDENGREYWEARELMPLLEYNKWNSFHKVIKKAMISCELSNNSVGDWFVDVKKQTTSRSGRKTIIIDYKLSRYACYLIIQNANSKHKNVALCKTYIAFQTRKRELFNNMNTTELATYFFIKSQAESKIKNDGIKGEMNVNKTYYKVGSKVRKTIQELGGTMPEDLPTPEKSLKELEKENKKNIDYKD